ncbi:hypothetical protein BGZ94_001606 [Podila epigama]|nr:hypothetical protein BGZ94_001606 [Podila epigama]
MDPQQIEQAKAYMWELVKEPYFFPTVIISVAIAVFATYWTDKKQEEKLQKELSAKGDSDQASATDATSSSKPKAFALPTTELPPPITDRIFSPEELAKYDGEDTEADIYVAVKGTVFNVTAKRSMYGPGGGYSCFAGKDASKALGKSSLHPEDCVADYSGLDMKELKVLNDWYSFFEKRYPIVGKTE